MSNSKPISAKSVLTISMVTLGAMSGGVTTSAHAQAGKETAPVEFRAPARYSDYRIPQPTEYAPVSQGTPLDKPDVKYYEKVKEASRQRIEMQRQAAQKQVAERQVQNSVNNRTAIQQTMNQQMPIEQYLNPNSQELISQAQGQMSFQQGVAQTRYGNSQLTFGNASPVQTPAIQTPDYSTPQFRIQTPELTTPQMTIPQMANAPMNLAGASIPQTNVILPSGKIPDLQLTQVGNVPVNLSGVSIPQTNVSVSAANIPGMNVSQVGTPQMNLPGVIIPETEFAAPSAALPSIQVPEFQAQSISVPQMTTSGVELTKSGVVNSVSSILNGAAQTGAQMMAGTVASQALNSGSSAGAGFVAASALGTAGEGASMIASQFSPFGGADNDEEMSFSNEDLMNKNTYTEQAVAQEFSFETPPFDRRVSFEQKQAAMRSIQQPLPPQGMAHLATTSLLQSHDDELLGDAVEVLPGDTLFRISERYRIALRALVETNDLQPPFELEVGSYLYLPPPNIHVVEAGETLYAISRRYNVDTRSLANMNGLPKPWTIYPGDQMILPNLARDSLASEETAIASADAAILALQSSNGVATPVVGEVALGTLASQQISTGELRPDPAKLASSSDEYGRFDEEVSVNPKSVSANVDLPSNSKGFLWPVTGNLVKAYGKDESGKKNDGINIGANAGSPIKAASDGYVVYAGSELPGFGFLVLINHGGGWVTAYAHAKELLVEEGQAIRQGQTIAKVGETGSVDSPQLHFQLRKGKTPIDPTNQLSGKRAI